MQTMNNTFLMGGKIRVNWGKAGVGRSLSLSLSLSISISRGARALSLSLSLARSLSLALALALALSRFLARPRLLLRVPVRPSATSV